VTDTAQGVAIREARDGDAEAIAALLGELGYPTTAEVAGERLARLRADAASWLWVAAEGERLVGLVGLHVMPLLERGPFARITALVVAEDWRRRGVGRALMARAHEQAVAEGCERMELSSADRRADAHAFYRDIGFEEASRRFLKYL
jgi:GNAT superfamily N-acetyltransferase